MTKVDIVKKEMCMECRLPDATPGKPAGNRRQDSYALKPPAFPCLSEAFK
jgi:hypothetical protein